MGGSWSSFLVACVSVSRSVGPSVITSHFWAFRAETRANLSYCPCPDAILPLLTRTRLMLSCIRPCFLLYDRSLLDESTSKGIDRLIETRTVLERLRSIDHKLRYQVEKLVRAANVNAQGKFCDVDFCRMYVYMDVIDDDWTDNPSLEIIQGVGLYNKFVRTKMRLKGGTRIFLIFFLFIFTFFSQWLGDRLFAVIGPCLNFSNDSMLFLINFRD